MLQEREMLWAAMENVDQRLRENAKLASSYQGEIERLRRNIVRMSEQLRRAKRENVSLQQILNVHLLAKFGQYPV